ncbi:MAG: alpha-L-glutamate ligase-like protein [Gemmataceae bacterium]
MGWVNVARRLREMGILGINRRNAACILDHNPRAAYPIVDDKLRLHRLCATVGVPTPAIYTVIQRYSELSQLPDRLAGYDDFVVKPNRGSGGRGILVVVGRDGNRFQRVNRSWLDFDDMRRHVADTLSGLYSLGGRPDTALVQQRVRVHPALSAISFQGVPDVRVIVYRGQPAMAMLRLPTRKSGGRANLHQGGIGVGIDLASGTTHHAVRSNRFIASHPDTEASLIGVRVPAWDDILAMACRVASAVGLGYLGVDIVIDATNGPLLLEANARPGLAIQIANATGLRSCLDMIDARLAHNSPSKLLEQAA